MNFAAPIDFIKRHPVGFGAGVFLLGVLYLVWRAKGAASSGSSGATTQTDPNATAAQAALNVAQIQGSYALATQKLQADVATHVADLAAGVQTQQSADQLAAAHDYITYLGQMGTLQAGVQNNQIAAQLSAAQIAANVAINENNNQADIAKANIHLQDTEAARNQYDFQTAVRLQNDLQENTLNQFSTLLSQAINRTGTTG
jgi:hypothetical protein